MLFRKVDSLLQVDRSDAEAEWKVIEEESLKAGAYRVAVSHHWALGGAGATDLAQDVIDVCDNASNFKYVKLIVC